MKVATLLCAVAFAIASGMLHRPAMAQAAAQTNGLAPDQCTQQKADIARAVRPAWAHIRT